MPNERSAIRQTPTLFEGAGLLLVSPLFLPGVAVVSRPVIKALIRSSLALADLTGPASKTAARWLDQLTEETREELSDLMAEARRERAAARARPVRARVSHTVRKAAKTARKVSSRVSNRVSGRLATA